MFTFRREDEENGIFLHFVDLGVIIVGHNLSDRQAFLLLRNRHGPHVGLDLSSLELVNKVFQLARFKLAIRFHSKIKKTMKMESFDPRGYKFT